MNQTANHFRTLCLVSSLLLLTSIFALSGCRAPETARTTPSGPGLNLPPTLPPEQKQQIEADRQRALQAGNEQRAREEARGRARAAQSGK